MNEERTLILEMLATGRISVEQANQLLDALQVEQPSNTNASAVKRSAEWQWNQQFTIDALCHAECPLRRSVGKTISWALYGKSA
jgi:glycerol-3-phosphate O-acyltransferase